VFRLMPKQLQLFERFERLAALGVEAAAALGELLRAPDQAATLVPRIEQLEQQGDDINREALEMLQKGVSAPFERSELLSLLGELDDLCDAADAAAHRLVLYRVKTIKPEALVLGEILVKTATELVQTVRALRTGKPKETILASVAEVNRLENQGDVVMRGAIGALFTSEQNAIELIKWKELFEILEEAIDTCEHVANRIEAIVIKHA
jgi:predicted phosphate transport protein (TIGR00153 family)